MSEKELFMLAVPSFMGITGYQIIYYYRFFSISIKQIKIKTAIIPVIYAVPALITKGII